MKWIMYAKKGDDERIFYDSSSGNIERSIVSPKLKIELNKAGSFSFTILPTHPMYDFFTKMKTYIRIMQDDFEVFRGRVLQIEDSTYKEREIECEGDLAYLIDSLQPPDKTTTSTSNSSTSASVSNNYYRNSATDYVDGLTYQNGIKNLSTAQRNSITSGYTVQTVMTPTVPKTGESNTRETIALHFSNYITRHNNQVEVEKRFNVGNVTVTLKDNPASGQDFDSTSYRTTKTAIDSDLVKYFGGYVMTRKTDGVVYIDYLKNPGSVSQQNITLGMNLIDLQKTSDSKEIFSRLVPIGDKGLTLAAINPQTSNWYIKNEAAETKYGIIYKVESFSGASTTSELNELAKTYMAANCKEDPIRFNIKAIDMNLLDGSVEVIRLGSTIRVVSDPHGVDESLTVMSIEYDIQSPDNNTYEIGDPSITLSQKAKNDKNAAAASTSRAGSRSSRAVDVLEAAGGIEDTINQHATSISFVADKVFSVEAEEIKMAAKLMALEADLIDIHTNVLKITSGNIEIVADIFRINNSAYISSDPEADSSLALFGNPQVHGDFTVGGVIYGALQSSRIIAQSIYFSDYMDVDEESGQVITSGNLKDAITGFGEVTYSASGATVPYNTFSQENAGTITFNMADTAWYADRVSEFRAAEAAASASGRNSVVVDTVDISQNILVFDDDSGEKAHGKVAYASGAVTLAYQTGVDGHGEPIFEPVGNPWNFMFKDVTPAYDAGYADGVNSAPSQPSVITVSGNWSGHTYTAESNPASGNPATTEILLSEVVFNAASYSDNNNQAHGKYVTISGTVQMEYQSGVSQGEPVYTPIGSAFNFAPKNVTGIYNKGFDDGVSSAENVSLAALTVSNDTSVGKPITYDSTSEIKTISFYPKYRLSSMTNGTYWDKITINDPGLYRKGCESVGPVSATIAVQQ